MLHAVKKKIFIYSKMDSNFDLFMFIIPDLEIYDFLIEFLNSIIGKFIWIFKY